MNKSNKRLRILDDFRVLILLSAWMLTSGIVIIWYSYSITNSDLSLNLWDNSLPSSLERIERRVWTEFLQHQNDVDRLLMLPTSLNERDLSSKILSDQELHDQFEPDEWPDLNLSKSQEYPLSIQPFNDKLMAGFSYYQCRRGACQFWNLYRSDNAYMLFLGKNWKGNDWNSKEPCTDGSIMIRPPIGKDRKNSSMSIALSSLPNQVNVTILLHYKDPPKKLIRSRAIKEQVSLVDIPHINLGFRGILDIMVQAWYTVKASGNRLKGMPKIGYRYLLNTDMNEYAVYENPFTKAFEWMNKGIETSLKISSSKPVRFHKCMMGTDSDFQISKVHTEKLKKNDLRAQSYHEIISVLRQYANKIIREKESASPTTTTSSKIPELKKVCYISRQMKDSRKILNEKDFINAIQSRHVNLTILVLENLTFQESVIAIAQCDVLIGVYSQWLSYLAFLSPLSSVIELFPYGIETPVHQNLALMMSIRYMKWVDVFTIDGKTILNEKDPNEIISYYLSQDISLHINSVMAIFDIVIQPHIPMLAYMPWEQLNNQIIEFKSACAMATLLNRVLILPPIGHRKDEHVHWEFSFDIFSYHWIPFSKYFNHHQLTNAPCKIMDYSNFKSFYGINHKFNIGNLHYNPVAHATSPQQLIDYYGKVLQIPHGKVIDDGRMYQLIEAEILAKYGQNKDRVLAIGAPFWLFSFGIQQPYPLTEYVNYMNIPLYAQIVKSLEISDSIRIIVLKALSKFNSKTRILAVHIRRGDYWNKCKSIKNPNLRSKCYPSIEDIGLKIQNVLESHSFTNLTQNADPDTRYSSRNDSAAISVFHKTIRRNQSNQVGQLIIPSVPRENSSMTGNHNIIEKEEIRQKSSSEDIPFVVYISTNIGEDRAEFTPLASKYPLIFFDDLFNDYPEISAMDSNEKALLDMTVCIERASFFIGNFYSSFSRTIFEKRILDGREYLTF